MTEGADVLRRIVARRREVVAEAVEVGAELLERAEPLAVDENAFLAALSARRGLAVIAEVKLGSPRIGSLVGRVDPVAQARMYAANGAAALSVVVEPDFFSGSYGLLSQCLEASGLPAIAKDFVVDPVQLVWAREAGASAVLLIAALHEPAELRRLARLARGLGLAPLVETHDTADIALLDGAPWELVGINHRDLSTFEVDLDRSRDLVPLLPAGALRVAESGIASAADVARLRAAGFDAFLVGEALLLADDPAAKLRELTGSPPHPLDPLPTLRGEGDAPARAVSTIVKVCGVTRPEDAALAAALGADLLGLNFHPPSPRYLDPERDRSRLAEIAAAAAGVPLVGVFVDRPPEEIDEIAAAAGLALVQLHGDEGPDFAARFGARAVKVFRRSAPPPAEELARYPAAWGFLFDAPPRRRGPRPEGPGDRIREEPYGGTGESWDHGLLRGLLSGLAADSAAGGLGDRPVLVAGGIRPGTARAALAASGARGIDVCSGVESAPGVKDPELMRRLFEEVRHGAAAP